METVLILRIGFLQRVLVRAGISVSLCDSWRPSIYLVKKDLNQIAYFGGFHVLKGTFSMFSFVR